MATLLDGKIIAADLLQNARERISVLQARGLSVGLAVILVGSDPASQIYVRNKGLLCEELGILSQTIRLPEETAQEALEAVIDRLNADASVDGILLQLPLPSHLDAARALERIAPEKDVDGLHPVNAGLLFQGGDGITPCTPGGVMAMLRWAQVPLCGKRAVVVGRSNLVGKPVAMLLLRENCTVTICHSRTEGLADVTREADILIVAAGKPRLITADMVKPGAAVIDVGVNRVDGALVGDVDFPAVERIAGYISPVPGGVGKMTMAMLMQNTVRAAERKAK